jgi:large subunit ribosomal protein L21
MANKEKFAVIKIGGAQEIVREGDLLEVNRLEGKEGSKLKLKEVLLVFGGEQIKVGTPNVSGAEVTLEILGHTKGEKVEIRKFRAKSRYRRKTGHRQPITKARVEKIET